MALAVTVLVVKSGTGLYEKHAASEGLRANSTDA